MTKDKIYRTCSKYNKNKNKWRLWWNKSGEPYNYRQCGAKVCIREDWFLAAGGLYRATLNTQKRYAQSPVNVFRRFQIWWVWWWGTGGKWKVKTKWRYWILLVLSGWFWKPHSLHFICTCVYRRFSCNSGQWAIYRANPFVHPTLYVTVCMLAACLSVWLVGWLAGLAQLSAKWWALTLITEYTTSLIIKYPRMKW